MVGNHVAQRAGHLVELAARFDAHRLGGGDLHVIDAVAIPDRLEQAVGEAERHDALHGVLAEEVVDAEDLVLVQRAQDVGIEIARRLHAVAERLLDHDATPERRLAAGVGALLGELRLAELVDDGAEEAVGDGQVEDGVALCAVSSLRLAQHVADPTVDLGLGEIARDVRHLVGEPFPRRLVDAVDVELRALVADEALQHVVEAVAPLFGGAFAVADADQCEVFRQHAAVREVVEGRHHQALGEIAAGAEDHHGAGIGRLRPPARRRFHPLRGRGNADRLGVRHRDPR